MSTEAVLFARVYITESEGRLRDLLRRLHDQEQVRGVTVYRAVAGYGASGVMHESTLVDMSLDLPLVVEFFDAPDKVRRVCEHIDSEFEPGHVVTWPATVNA